MAAQSFCELHAGSNRSVDLFAVVKVVRQGSVHIGKGETVLGSDLICRLSKPLMPDSYLLDSNAVSRNSCLTSSNIRCAFYMIDYCCVHAMCTNSMNAGIVVKPTDNTLCSSVLLHAGNYPSAGLSWDIGEESSPGTTASGDPVTYGTRAADTIPAASARCTS